MLRLIAIIVLIVLAGCASERPYTPPPVIQPNINIGEITARPESDHKEILYKHFDRDWINSPYLPTYDYAEQTRTGGITRCYRGSKVSIPIYDIKVRIKDNKCISLWPASGRADPRYTCASDIRKCGRTRAERDQIIEALIGIGARF